MVSDFRPHESYQFFLQEVPELLQILEEGLLDLQQDHSAAKIHRLMRAAHSIKGGAACVGLSQIQTLAHYLETALKTCSQTAILIDVELENLMLQAFDCLKAPLIEEMQIGKCDDIAAVALTNPIWQELTDKLSETQMPNRPQVFLFGSDLRKGLKRIETILHQPDLSSLSIALRTQIEIFKGLGEIAQVPRLVSLASHTLTLLQVSPQQSRAIGQQALDEFRSLYLSLQTHTVQQPLPSGLDGGHGDGSDLLPFSAEPPAQLFGSFRESMAEVILSDPDAAEWWTQYQANISGATSRSRLVSAPSQALIPVPESTNTISETVTAATPTSTAAAPRSLGLRQDWGRLDLLSNLIGELATQDNRCRSQQDQQIETIEFLNQCFNRVRQLAVSLNRWSQQHTPLTRPPLPPGLAAQRSRLNYSSDHHSNGRSQEYLQTTTQSVVEELAQIGEAIQDLMLLDQRLQHIAKQKQKTLKQVQSNLFQARMLPISELLNQFPRMVHDLAVTEQKQVTLELKGKHTLVDKAILEKLYDPLVHLVRNAFDHGIESPEVRQILGKPIQGRITIQTRQRGNQIYIEVQDDGQGIDVDQIRATAIEMNLLSESEADGLPNHRLYEHLFSPGFSTVQEANNLSGRGMGLYAVYAQVNALKGVVTIDSQRGRGTTFTLRLPLTLTITKLLVFSIQGNLLAIPVDMLESITVASEQLFQTEQGQVFYHWQGHFVPIYPETLLLNYHYPRVTEATEKGIDEPDQSWKKAKQFPLLLVSHEADLIALKVDQIVLEQDLVIKPFNDAIVPPAGLVGCTILGDGHLAPVLDGPALVEKWLQFSQTPATAPPPNFSVPSVPIILVVDDSLTIRHALSTTLGKAGYQVIQAKDGWEAVTQLRLRSDIAAIICDIEMPRMNGLEFLSRCRQQGLALPIIMLTYRSSEKYRQLSKQLGAIGYLTKPYLDKELLGLLEGCLEAKVPSVSVNHAIQPTSESSRPG